jgi:uncharacterized membrane protein YsdA (DUF1294 family)/cold shock CspA family protein
MRYVGRIIDWNDAKGFGFVEPNGGGDRAFVHIKAFERHGRRPVTGELIAYTVQRDAKGRLNASTIRFAGAGAGAGAGAKRETTLRSRFPRKAIAGLALVALLAGWRLHKLPIEVVFVYVVMSGIAIFLYAFDKSAALRGGWRTQETTLHAVALVGGWPGALLAQDLFRHKSRKAEFQAVFWVTVVLNVGAVAWVLQSGAARG